MDSSKITRRRFLQTSMGWAALALSSPAPFSLAGTGGRLRTAETNPAISALLDRAPEARYWVSTAMEDASCSRCHSRAIGGCP